MSDNNNNNNSNHNNNNDKKLKKKGRRRLRGRRQWCRSLAQATTACGNDDDSCRGGQGGKGKSLLLLLLYLLLSKTTKKGAKPVELVDFSPLGPKDKDEFMSVGKALKTAKWLWLSPSVYYFNASTVNASLAASLGNTATARGASPVRELG